MILDINSMGFRTMFNMYCVYQCISNEALPKPISKRKDKEYKKKKSKTSSALNVAEAEVGVLKTSNALPEVASYNTIIPTNTVLDEKPGWSFRDSQRARNECTQFFFTSRVDFLHFLHQNKPLN